MTRIQRRSRTVTLRAATVVGGVVVGWSGSNAVRPAVDGVVVNPTETEFLVIMGPPRGGLIEVEDANGEAVTISDPCGDPLFVTHAELGQPWFPVWQGEGAMLRRDQSEVVHAFAKYASTLRPEQVSVLMAAFDRRQSEFYHRPVK